MFAKRYSHASCIATPDVEAKPVRKLFRWLSCVSRSAGTPAGEPPFSLVGGVDMEMIPESSNWIIFAGFGLLCILFEMLRRRRQTRKTRSIEGSAKSFPIIAGVPLFTGAAKPPGSV